MTKMNSYLKGILLLSCFMNAAPVLSQEIDDNTMYIYVEADVIDTIKLEAIKAEKVRVFHQEKNEKNELLKKQKAMTAQLIALGRENGKIKDEDLYDYASNVFEDYKEVKQAIISHHYETYYTSKVDAAKELPEDKVMKMFKKKKVSKLFVPYLSALLDEQTTIINNLASEEPDLSIDPQDIPYKKGMKRILNPNNRAYRYCHNTSNLDDLDMTMQIKGWEWLRTEESEEIYTMAPFTMRYKKYNSHPQYRVFDDKVFDNDGNLVCLLYLLRSNNNIIDLLREAMLKDIYIADYKANKYDILNAPASTQEDVKNMLGLPFKPSVDAKTAKKNRKIINDYFTTQANEIKVAAGSREQRARAKRKADEARGKMGEMLFGALINVSFDSNYKTAYTFIQKIEEDHKNDLNKIWKISRVSPTSFKVAFMKGRKLTYTGLVTINQTKPYSWQFTFKLIPNEEEINENSAIWDMEDTDN